MKSPSVDTSNRSIKCVVWDLDNTIWEGILLEGEEVVLRSGIMSVIKELDNRGILQSIASKNDADLAMAKLKAFELDEYFLYPQMNWNSKADSIQTIRDCLNIGLEAIAFIDDQPFELDEVSYACGEVLCIGVESISDLLSRPEFTPRFITEESKHRRDMYLSDMRRNQSEADYKGSNESFLRTLNLSMTIFKMKEEDLMRAEELTLRTHQMNTTGYTFSFEELDQLRQSDHHLLLGARLTDCYGTYGTVGLALIELKDDAWILRLLLMSCRVISRGVGSVLLTNILNRAKVANVRLLAEYKPNERNRIMYVTYKFAGFTDLEQEGDRIVLHHKLERIPDYPDYVMLHE